MPNSHLSYFLENFELAYSCQPNWESFSIGFDESCKIILSKPEIKNPNSYLNTITWKTWKGKKIPFLMNTKDCDEIVSKHKNGSVSVNLDIVSSAWFLLSGVQELDKTKRDKYGRFDYQHSSQKALEITETPVVNYYFDILKEAILLAHGIDIQPERKLSATITHDIDEIASAWKHRIRIAHENKKYIKAIGFGVSHIIKPFEPWKNIKELADYNSSKKIPSTFFFLPKNNKLQQIKNADYEWNSSYVKKIIGYLNNSEHEIGVHGSYKTHDSEKELTSDIACFKQRPTSNRFHFLQFEQQTTSEILDSARIEKDSSLGFQENIGFRNSVCTPFKLYNFETEKSFKFIEIPLNIMDCTLEYENYMNLSPNKSLERIKQLVSEIKKFNGNVCLNWHNTYFSEYEKKEWKTLYKEILLLLIAENCTFYTIKDLK
ncbi:MAG: polysaccharide deacetylase family protein [Flavobacteriales bacterium]